MKPYPHEPTLEELADEFLKELERKHPGRVTKKVRAQAREFIIATAEAIMPEENPNA